MGLDWEGNRLQTDGQRWMDRECPETAWNWKIGRWCQPGTGETPVFYRWGEKNTPSEAENGKPKNVKKTRESVVEATGRGYWGAQRSQPQTPWNLMVGRCPRHVVGTPCWESRVS